VGLAACGAAQEDATGRPAAGEPVVKLTYLHQWSQRQGHGPATEALVARFNEASPTTQVEPVYTAGYYDKLTAVLAGGDFPDMVTSNVEYLLSLVRKQVPVSPDGLAKGAYRFNKNDMVAVSRDMVTFDGKVMALPYILSNLGLAFNQTLFKQRGLDSNKPATTWDELVELGRRLGGGSGDTETWGLQLARGTGAVPVLTWMCFLWQNRGAAIDMQRRVATWNSPAGVEALQFYVDLYHRHRVTSLELPPNPHLAGRAGMWTTPTGSMSVVERDVGDQFEWSSAVLPRGKQAASNVGGHTLVVMKTNREHERAWRFVHWFTSPQHVVDFNVPSTTLPPWRSAQQQPAWQRYLREQPRIKPFVDMLAYGHPPDRLATGSDVLKVLGEGIESALTLKQPPKAALDEAARVAEPLINQG
jgi:ABC-type glycerol-3-phosphate transport system substrate-binding protein